MAIRLPRARRTSFEFTPTSSWPSILAEPVIFADFGSRPMTARIVTDLPGAGLADDADESRRRRRRGRRRAPLGRSPAVVGNETRRSRIDSAGFSAHVAPLVLLRIERVAQAVTDEVDAEDRDDEHKHWGRAPATSGRMHGALRVGEQVAPARLALAGLDAVAEERQRRLGDDGGRRPQWSSPR